MAAAWLSVARKARSLMPVAGKVLAGVVPMTMIALLCCCAGTEPTCKPDTSILGTADIKLSNGETDGTGYSLNECEYECASNRYCESFVYSTVRFASGYCELWSKTTGTSKVDGTMHCVKNTGEHASEYMMIARSPGQMHARAPGRYTPLSSAFATRWIKSRL